MKYTMTEPCDDCPFLAKFKKAGVFTMAKLRAFSSGQFACHKTCEVSDDGPRTFEPKENSVHCAGALIFLEKRGQSNQMMRIAERLGMYDASKLNMKAKVR